MSAGIPLTDADRLPWLRKIAETIDGGGHMASRAWSPVRR